MTKEEFTLQRLKDEYAQYRVLFPIYVGIVVCSVVLIVAGLLYVGVGDDPSRAIRAVGIAVAFALFTPFIKGRRDDAAIAISEYEAFLADPTRDESKLSETTMRALNAMVIKANQLMQQWIAYGILSVVLIGAFIFLAVVIRDEPVLLLISSLLLVMGIPLALLAFKTYRTWKLAKEVEANK